MKLPPLEDCGQVLATKFVDRAQTFPNHFAALIPRSALLEQLPQVGQVVSALTGLACPQGLAHVLQVWDLDCLEVAGFSFGNSGSYAGRLLQWNQQGAHNAWWEDSFDQRPSTLLRIAQGDPHVLLVDVRSDHVFAYESGAGAKTLVKVAPDLPVCLRALITLQLDASAEGVSAAHELAADQCAGCDAGFWEEQWRRWSGA